MLRTGLLNPHILDLVARIRHTNTLVISDRGFPFWPQIETVDISLIDDLPTVMQVFAALKANFTYGNVWVAEEFKSSNSAAKLAELQEQVGNNLKFESHVALKQRVPGAIGLIRTGDTTQYANMVIESA